jgi:hypothetical protein
MQVIIEKLILFIRLIMMMLVLSFALMGTTMYWLIYFPIWWLKRFKRNVCNNRRTT